MSPEMDFSPQEIMSQAAEDPNGLKLIFVDTKTALRYRMRCYKIRQVAQARLVRNLEQNEDGIIFSGWEDLVFEVRENELWVGKLTQEKIGLVNIERGD